MGVENEAVIKSHDKLGYAEEAVCYCGKQLIEDQQQPRVFAPIKQSIFAPIG